MVEVIMTKRILWWSSHGPLPIHRELLQKFLGTFKITHKKRIESAEEIKREFISGNYDVLYVAGPLTVLEKLTQLDVPFLVTEKKRVHKNNADFTDSEGKSWRVTGFNWLDLIQRVERDAISRE